MEKSTTTEYLPKWLFLISSVSLFNTIQCFMSTTLTSLIYSEKSIEVSPLMARMFGTWTVLSAIIRLYGSVRIHDRGAYDLTMATFFVALVHFGSEWLVFNSTSIKSPGLVSPLIIASSSLGWMISKRSFYVSSTRQPTSPSKNK